MLAQNSSDLACVACVAKVSNRKFFDRKRLKISTPREMRQRLPTALAQIKAGNRSETY